MTIHYDYQSASQEIYAAELNEYPIAHANALNILVHLKGWYTIRAHGQHCPIHHICWCMRHSSVGASIRTNDISRHYNNVWGCTAHAIALGIPESGAVFAEP